MDDPNDFARPRVAAGVILRDPSGKVLLVKPTYKDGWDLPGGYVNNGESPAAAAIREVEEELGIDLKTVNFRSVDWAPHPDEGDKLLFLFVSSGQYPLSDFRLAPDEIGDAAYVEPDAIGSRVPKRLYKRIVAAIDGNGYLEHGTPNA